MKKIKYVIIIVFAMQITMNYTQPTDWYKFRSEELGFKIEFPKKPKFKIYKSDPELGFYNITNNFYYITTSKKDDNFDYFVLQTEFTDSLTNSDKMDEAAIQRLYQGFIDKEVSFLHANLLSEKKIIFKGYSGIVVKYEKIEDDGLIAVINMRIFLVKNNFYKMKTVTYTAFQKDDNPSIKRFFDSFDLLYL
jgi:hypothetical protein